MKIFELSHIGQFHTNHNEDYKVVSDIGENRIMIAVMDGCSMGTDAYFASTLIGKCLRKIAKDINYIEFVTNKQKSLKINLEELTRQLFKNLIELNSQLDLKPDELLSTLILGVLDQKNKTGELLIVGDGVVCLNGEITEFQQDNKPDYLGYHLQDDFKIWYEENTQKMTLGNIHDLTISTDGIYTFKAFNTATYPSLSEDHILEMFFKNKVDVDNKQMLKNILHQIEEEHGLRPSDDITMIRWVDI